MLLLGFSPSLSALKGESMKSNLEKISNLERKLIFEIPSSTVDSKFQKAYQGIQKQVSLPGFRKGKAPIPLIKEKYKGQVMSDVVNDIIKEAYVAALTEHELDPVSFPQISFDHIEEGKDFQFSATLEIQPQIEVNKTSGLKIQKEKLEVSKEQVSEVIKNLLDSKMEYKDSTKDTLENGDIAIIDFDGSIDGEPLAGGKGEAYPLEIGANQFIPGFEEKLVGCKVNEERTIDLKFPDDYHAKEIAGKPVSFKVKLHKIQSKVCPELNDEFAKSVGDYENLAGLETNIRETLEKRESKRIEDEFRKRLLEEVVKNNSFEVPQSQVKEQKKLLLQDMENRFKSQGMGEKELKEYEEKWSEDLEKTAKFLIQSGYIVNKLSKDREIKVEDADIHVKLEEYAQESGISLEQLSSFYQQEESKSRLSYQILEEKVIDSIAKDSKIEEVSKDKIQD